MGGAEVQIRGAKSAAIISGQAVTVSGNVVNISGQPVTVSGNVVNISGQPVTVSGNVVNISGQPVIVSGNIIQVVNVSGQCLCVNISGQSVTVSGNIINISGQIISTITVPGNPVNDFNQGIAIATGATSTHTYTATGNFKLSGVEASASGAMKVEVDAGTSGSVTTRMIAFTTESNLIAQLRLYEEVQITSGQIIQVVRTNREEQAMDVFSTILGFNS